MDPNPKIIGLSGTNGSGKDTVGHILAEKYGYLFISVTDLLRNEAEKRGLPTERENLRMISAEWRRQAGLGVLIDKALVEYRLVKDQYKGLAIASLRNPGEADRIHELGGVVAWIDAETRTRYDRIQANAASRGRADEDNKTFEQFKAEEEAEMQASGDDATLNMGEVKNRADVFIDNDTTDLAVLTKLLEKSLNLGK